MKLNRMVKSRERFSNPEMVISGRIFYGNKLVSGSIAIANERIIRIGKNLKGDLNLDFGDRIILPGFTDMHVHFREPGMEHKENFETGSRAGLRGGITTYFDMPNTKPPADSFRRIKEKIEIAGKRSYSDFGIYGLVSETTEPENISNADACKIFMGASTASEEFGDYRNLRETLRKFQDKVIAVHPEHKDFIRKTASRTLMEHYLARKDAEIEAVKLMVNYKDLKFHLCHISVPECLDLLAEPGRITFETTPHHLLLNLKSGSGARYKVNPPLRTEEEQGKIYRAFLDGKVKILASDHAPHLLEEKENFETAPSGMPGIETMIPLLILLAKRGEIPIERVVKTGATAPAALFSLKKGEIKEGYYADLTVWDPTDIREIKDKEVWSKCGWSPFSGWSAVFPSHVYLRGSLMVEDYEFVGGRVGRHVGGLQEGKAKI
ncbi:MAG: dihydroorotase family protein [Thermoplasmata archaeon]|nr:dihydroorotase family protein [Thermoplasmata archaeon]